MAIPLAVLIVEDTESDAQLILRLLRNADYELTSERVETAQEMRAALEEQSWDIVISDYRLPQFDGTAALTLLQELRPDIPFIIVSGTIGEETAVAVMKAGAHDYLMKGNLERLVPAVKRELAQAEVRRKRRQAETELRVNEARWRALIESSADAIAILAMDGTILYESPSAQRISGYSPDELTGRNIMEELHPDDQAMAAEFFNRVLQQASVPISGQVRAKHKDQTWRWVECTGTNLLDDPIIHGIVLNYRDITERRQNRRKDYRSRRNC